MIGTVLLIATAALLVYAGYKFVGRYQAADGTVWNKLLTAGMGSASVLWSWLTMFGGYLMVWTVNAADAFNLPDVRSWVQAQLSPEMFGVALLTVALVSFFARLRTL